MKAKVFWVWTFLILFGFPLVCAVPPSSNPVQDTVTSGILSIIYPKNPYFEQFSSSVLHFHVFNSSGVTVTPTSTNCTIHLYNSTGNHIAQKNLSWDSNGVEYYFTLNTTFTQERRNIPYIVFCSGSNEKGFLSTELYVGTKTDIYKDLNVMTPITLLGLGVICILLYIGKNWKLEKKMSILRLMVFLFVLWTIPLIIAFMQEWAEQSNFSADSVTLINVFYSSTMWVNITFTFVVIIYLLYNLLKYLGVDVVKSFNRGGR